MAFTEKYVTVSGAGAHDGSSEANAWTFAEMIAAAPAAGTRVNIKTGTYNSGTVTLPASGSSSAPIILRGYSSSIGDLDAQGRDDDSLLNTTNMPDFTLTGKWTPSPNCYLQNLDITGNINDYLIGSTAADNWGLISCRVINTNTGASAAAIQGDDYVCCINCDVSCTGTSHVAVIDGDNYCLIYGCRIKGSNTSGTLLSMQFAVVSDTIFIGPGGTSVGWDILDGATPYHGLRTPAFHCTFYNLGIAIRMPELQPASPVPILDCHITDCAKVLDNYNASNAVTIEGNNRTRDNTTPRTGIEPIIFNEIITDTGGPATDYIDASSDDFRLIYTAPGKNAGMMPFMDCGALQRSESTGAKINSGRIFG